MGMFSYFCQISGRQIRSDFPLKSKEYNIVRMYYLINGVVEEEIHGLYNGYGSINPEDQTQHFLRVNNKIIDVLKDAKSKEYKNFENYWLSEDWENLVEIHLNGSKKNGFAVVLEAYAEKDYIPNKISEDDPDQGWCIEEENDFYEENEEGLEKDS